MLLHFKDKIRKICETKKELFKTFSNQLFVIAQAKNSKVYSDLSQELLSISNMYDLAFQKYESNDLEGYNDYMTKCKELEKKYTQTK